MDLYDLEPGDRVRLTDGTIAEVIAQTDGRTIQVRHIESPHNHRWRAAYRFALKIRS